MHANNSILINTQLFEPPADDGCFSAGTRRQEHVFAHADLDRHQSCQQGLTYSEFTDANNSILINTQPFELPADNGFCAGIRWQEPVFTHVVERMRWLAEHPERAREIGEFGRLRIAKQLSFEVIGERMRARLQD